MKAIKKPDRELKEVMREINRINTMYSGQLNVMNDGFKNYVINKLKDLEIRKNELMKGLGYV